MPTTEQSLREQVGATLRKARGLRGLSIRALAAKAGVSTRTIQQMERGQIDATLRTVTKIAAALETTVQVMFTPAEQVCEEPEWHREIWDMLTRLAMADVEQEGRIAALEQARPALVHDWQGC